MKKPVLIPLFATSVLLGCHDSDSKKSVTAITDQDVIVVKKNIAPWVGNYQGATPCIGCFSRCDDCPGMAVDLELKEDMSYVLQRESLSRQSEIERLEGKMIFKNDQQTQLELLNVTTRNLLFVDLENQILEIREDKTAKKYAVQSDFLLAKKNQVAPS